MLGPMATEYEAKILDVSPGDIAKRVLDAGGTSVGWSVQRRYVYDIVPGDQSQWLRLRDNGSKVTLTYKRIRHDGIDGTDEVEVEVGDFEQANRLLGMLGYRPKAYQENRRTSFLLNGAEVEVDEWPMIPPYVEIEGHNREHVVEVAETLGFTEDRLTGENTTKVYARYGIDLAQHTRLELMAEPPTLTLHESLELIRERYGDAIRQLGEQ